MILISSGFHYCLVRVPWNRCWFSQKVGWLWWGEPSPAGGILVYAHNTRDIFLKPVWFLRGNKAGSWTEQNGKAWWFPCGKGTHGACAKNLLRWQHNWLLTEFPRGCSPYLVYRQCWNCKMTVQASISKFFRSWFCPYVVNWTCRTLISGQSLEWNVFR